MKVAVLDARIDVGRLTLPNAECEPVKRIVVLGSTGSIGTNALDVVRSHADQMQVLGLTAHSKWEQLAGQAREFTPQHVVLADGAAKDALTEDAFPQGTEVEFGPGPLEELAAHPDVDVVVSGIVGAAGLRSTFAALNAGKTVALANKETLVVGGPLVMQTARRTGAVLLPVDSEHSAVFQALQCGRDCEVRRIVLTASGGPFRGWSREKLRDVTPEMALDHPTWDMGPRITIDSATMMNKALEVIEARWLFDVDPDRIEVVVHPQSVLHSFVEFVDGSVIAQLSPPDMRLPIQYALTWPERADGPAPRMDWKRAVALELEPPDEDAFPALRLGMDVARRGGTCGAALNAADEVAVERFLSGDLSFIDIPRLCREVVESHDFVSAPSLDDLFQVDARARQEARRWNC